MNNIFVKITGFCPYGDLFSSPGSRNIFVPAGRLKDDGETEMWKHDDSEMALPSRSEEEDEEDRKYSGDILLCVNPTFRSDSSLV